MNSESFYLEAGNLFGDKQRTGRRGYSFYDISRAFKRSFFHAFFSLLTVCVISVDLPAAENSATTAGSEGPAAYKKLSLTELMDIEVTLVSKRPEKLSTTASAIQVITGEEIRRSGANSLPEALRLAPNLEVAQVNSHDWAISARGFNNTLANKLLVMIDGRTIYTPLYAGVFWDVQNVMLEDIDRIEVVSGPGGTLWGANAVNGVINIVTKNARDTQGIFASAGGGSFLEDKVSFRYGSQIGSNLFFRIYGEHFDQGNTLFTKGREGTNAWDMNQGGFRLDWDPGGQDVATLEGNFYGGSEDGIFGDTSLNGQNVLGRWTHTFVNESELSAQMYFDRTWRQVPNSYTEDLKIYDIDVQYSLAIGERQRVVVGGGYRFMQDEIQNGGPSVAFLPANKNLNLFSAFVQDEIMLVQDKLKLTVGTKVEHNDYSGFEVQPSARLGWTITTNQFIWAAVSRAVRSPSRIDREVYAPAPPVAPGTTRVAGGPGFDSEKLLAFELGYRIHPVRWATFSASGYYNSYEDLRSVDVISPNNLILANHFNGQVWGVELTGNFQVTEWWRLRASYNYMEKHVQPTSSLAQPSVREGNDPNHWASFQSIMDLPGNLQLDITGRYVDCLHAPHVPAYITFDARIAWRYKEHLELSIIGQNLLDDQHSEFGTLPSRQEIPRSIFGKVTVWF